MSGTSARPLLRLKISPTRERVGGGGQTKILPEYPERLRRLARLVDRIGDPATGSARWFGGSALVRVEMDERCRAPSWAPARLFSEVNDARLVAPWAGGYLVEFGLKARSRLAATLRSPSDAIKQDISTVTDLTPVQDVPGGSGLDTAWRNRRDVPSYSFLATAAPFRSRQARQAVATRLVELARSGTATVLAIASSPSAEVTVRRAPAARALSSQTVTTASLAPYVAGGPLRIFLDGADRDTLVEASSSGAIVRWEAIWPLGTTSPGIAPVDTDIEDYGEDLPIVGVLDGGLSSRRYARAVAWTQAPFVDAAELDTAHGDAIARLIADAHAWNELLQLPRLGCRLGIAPVVPRRGYAGPWRLDHFLAYVDRVVREHPDTRVWNISANEPNACDADRVSDFGHQLNLIARRHGVLFVISAGNRDPGLPEIIAAPGDSNAALTVSGRLHTATGAAGGPCHVSRTGRGPDQMLKPELSWFSMQRVGPGMYGQASSWAAPLVSRLAAHTWRRLANPTPDLVKALLISAADHDEYRPSTGFGSPINPPLPWATGPDTVLVAWTAKLADRFTYTWEGIRIPPSLARAGRFRGRVRLVAILDAALNDLGYNYYSTRLQTSVRFLNQHGKWDNLIGSLATDKEEGSARAQDDKWQPIRCNTKRCTGKTIGRPELQVQARLFWRDLFAHRGVDPNSYGGDVTFVLSIQSIDGDPGFHDEFVDVMGASVEAEVIIADVEAPSS